MANGLDIKLELIPRDAGSGRFVKITDNMLNMTREVVAQQTYALASQVKGNIGATFKNPAAMQSAIGVDVRQRGSQWVGTIEARGEFTGVHLPFMAIQEYGGVVQTPEIFPARARVLRFFGKGGDKIFAKHTRPHPTRIPARSYLRTALESRQAEIAQAFRVATEKAVAEG